MTSSRNSNKRSAPASVALIGALTLGSLAIAPQSAIAEESQPVVDLGNCAYHQEPSYTSRFGYAWIKRSPDGAPCVFNIPSSVRYVNYVAVGGGGGGGGPQPGIAPGGGGGAGGVIDGRITGANALTITVGQGGRGGSTTAQRGQSGANTVIGGGAGPIVARGGGGGGSPGGRVSDGLPGGSGGGAAGNRNNRISGGEPVLGQGSPGGANGRCSARPAGGGGGHWGSVMRGSCEENASGRGGTAFLSYIYRGQRHRFGAGGGGGGNGTAGDFLRAGKAGYGGSGHGAGWNGERIRTAGDGRDLFGDGGGGGGNAVVGYPAGSGGDGSVILRWEKGEQSINFPQIPDRSMDDAGTFTIDARATSGLPLQVRSATAWVCTVSGSEVTIQGPGLCRLSAVQWGNLAYQEARPALRQFLVNPAATPQPEPETTTTTDPANGETDVDDKETDPGDPS